MKKYEGNMEKYEGIMKKYVPLYVWAVRLRKIPTSGEERYADRIPEMAHST